MQQHRAFMDKPRCAAIWLVRLFIFAVAAPAQAIDTGPSVPEYREALYTRNEQPAATVALQHSTRAHRASDNEMGDVAPKHIHPISALEQTRDSAKQYWGFNTRSRQHAEKIRRQAPETQLLEAQPSRLQILAWVSPLVGLILCGAFLLHQARRKQTELVRQIELGTSSLTAATLEARKQKTHAEHLHEKLQNVLKTSAIGIWEWSYAPEKLVWDEQMFEIYGVDPNDFEGLHTDWSSRVHRDDLDRATSLAQQHIENDINAAMEFRIVRPSGEIRYIYSNVYTEKDENGKPIRATGLNMDITELRNTERALLVSKETYRRLVEEVAEVIWSSTSDGILTYLSPQYTKLVGYTPEEHIGNHCLDLVHPEDQSELIKSIELLLESPDEPRTDEFRLRHCEGHYIWTSGTVKAVCNEKGSPVRMHGILHDIQDRKSAEIALAETESKFQRIAHNVPGMVYRYIIHPDGSDELSYVSTGSREVLEIEPQEAIEIGIEKVWERIHKDDQGWLAEAIAKSGEKLEPFLSEYRLVLPEKGPRWVQSYAQPIKKENGDIIWDGIVLDHTDRKEAELQLQNTQLQLESLAANLPGMIWRMEAKDGIGTITYLSSKSRELFAVDPEEAVADNEALRKHMHPEDVKAFLARQKVAIENAEPFGIEFRVDLPEQGQRWRQCSAHPVKNEAGEIIWNGITIDITDRKVAELALQEARDQIQRITENVPGMIYRFVQRSNGSQAVTFVSSKVRDMFEIEPTEALEDVQALFQFILPEDLILIQEAITESAATLTPFGQEYRVNLPQQGLRWRRAIGQPALNVNGDTTWDGVVIDITHTKHTELQVQRANEELARATKMKDEFLANMSHELRTPLSAILGMTEGLQEGIFGPVTKKQLDSLDVIKKSGSHLLELINEVLDLAKIESGSLDLDLAPVNVAHLCKSSLKLIAPQAEKKNIELNLSVPFGLPDFEADIKRLRQVLVNLLSNAIKFTPDGGWVVLEVERSAPGNKDHKESLRISVKDNGIGIAPEHIETLFNPFVQVDSSLSREYSGTGLGLSLVKRFAELHAGSVSVKSDVGVGSCFTIDLPLRKHSVTVLPESLEQRDEFHQTARANSMLAHNQNIRVLLAEDNELVAKTTVGYLQANGFRVELATDGATAIEAARTWAPDVILMDVQMPVINGFDAIREIRRISEHVETPIIALTGLAMEGDLNRCVSAGADHYLSKPYLMQNLVELILKVSDKADLA